MDKIPYWQSTKCSLKKRWVKPKYTKITTDQVFEMCKMFESGKYTYADLAKYFSKHISSIANQLNKRGYKAIDPSVTSRKYKLDETFFDDINTEEKAYFLGVLCSDGNIRKNNREIVLSVLDVDIDVLQKFSDAIKTDKPIFFVKSKTSNSRYALISISSSRMCEGLGKYGCVNNKTFKMTFPKLLNQNLYNHFIRGYFDGDGCIYVSNKNANRAFSIVGMLPFLLEVQKILIDNCGLNVTKIVQTGNSCDMVKTLVYCGKKQCIKIRDWLYKDATVFINRKKNKFNLV